MDFKALIRAQSSEKAFPATPALLAYANEPAIVPTAEGRSRTPFGQREAGRHLQAYGGSHDAIDWVMDCVRLIVETAGNAEWFLRDADGNKLVKHKLPDTPKDAKEAPFLLTKLIEEPNPFMDYEELIELTLIDYLLVGNSYWLKWRTNDAGQPLALYRLAPPFVKVVPGSFGVEAYQYQLPSMEKPLVLPPELIVHFKQANPHSPYLGLGLVKGGSRMLDLELALTDTQASYYEKKAQPSMVVQSERRVPREVFKRLQNQLRQMYGGPKNAGAMMVLEAGLKYQSIAPSAADAAFEPITTLSRDRILSMFRVPGSLLGIPDATGKVSDSQRVFDQKTMRPLLNKLQKAISRGVTSAWALDFFIDYDYIMPVEDRIRLTSSFAVIPGVRVREVREYAGLEPLGDERDDIVLNLPGENGTVLNHDGGLADRSLAGEAGRPPKGSNTAAFPAPGGALPQNSLASRATATNSSQSAKKSVDDISVLLEGLAESKAMTPANHDLHSRIVAPKDEFQVEREATVDQIVADARHDLLKAVHVLERSLLDDMERETKAIGDKLKSRLKKSEAWKTFMAMIAGTIEAASRSALSAAVIHQGRQGRIPDVDVDYDALAQEIVHRREGVRKITETLRDELIQKVSKALAEGEDRATLERAIRESMDFWRETKSETVALTEATHAYNVGTLEVARLTDHGFVYVHDGREFDEPCIEADGQIWTIEHAMSNTLEHPRCRRSFSPVQPT